MTKWGWAWDGRPASLWDCVQQLDLRFRNPEDEEAFTRSKATSSLRYLVLTTCLVIMRQTLLFQQLVLPQLRPPAWPIRSAGDARILFAAVYGVCIVVTVCLLLFVCLQLSHRRPASCNHEFVWMAWSCFHVVCVCLERPWNAVAVMKVHGPSDREYAGEDEEMSILLLLMVIPFVIAMGAPMRQHLQIFPAAAVPVSYMLTVKIFGCPNPSNIPSVLVTQLQYVAGSAFCAWRYERLERREWRQQHELSRTAALAVGMTGIAERLCDFVFRLDKELRVCEDEEAHASFLGVRAMGHQLSDFLAEGDRDRFLGMLQRASASLIPQCMPVTVLHRGGATEGELLAVDTGSQDPRYIIGMRIEFGLVAPDGASALQPGLDMLEALGLQRAGSDALESLSSALPETTVTGQCFHNGSLDDIATLGRAEHWYVNKSELQLTVPGRILGSGGHGVVLAATFHGKLVAVKVPRAQQDLSDMRHLVNELRILRHVRHRNLVMFHGAVVDVPSSSVAVVYEFVEGMTLEQYVRQRRDPAGESDCYGLIADVCSALRYLHEHDPPILHGDLKASNVMVEWSPAGLNAKLIDFGLSKLMSKGAKRFGGTIAWRAPELFLSDGLPVGTSVDVYSLGWLIYFIITGKLPHNGAQPPAVAVAVQEMLMKGSVGPLLWPPGVSFRAEGELLCARCLQFSPRLRPPMAEILATVAGWLTTGRACQFGFAVAHAVLPKVPWQEGLPDLVLEPPAARAEWEPPVAAGQAVARSVSGDVPPAINEAVGQMDVFAEGNLTLRGAWDQDGAYLAQLQGRSLCTWLHNPLAMRVWLCSIANDVYNGVIAAPHVVECGRVAFKLPSGAAELGRPADKLLSAAISVLFPAPAQGEPREQYLVSIRLRGWRPAPSRLQC